LIYIIHNIYNIALYFPDGPQFGREFVLLVLSGKKKLLPLGCFGGFNIPYFSKSKKLTKDDIFKKFIGDESLLIYLPDNPDMKSITRELLLSILFYGNRSKYLSLYEEYKELQIQRTTTGNRKYYAKVTEEMLSYLQNFKPINL